MKQILILVVFVISIPLFQKINFLIPYWPIFLVLLTFWILSWKIKIRFIKYVVQFFVLVITLFLMLQSNGLINNQLQIDKERSFIVDSHFQKSVIRFQQEATYMDYRIRFKVWNDWIIPINVIGRTLKLTGGDTLITVLGIGGLILLIVSSLNKFAFWETTVILLGIAAASLARHPDTNTFCFLLPPIIKIWWSGINNLKKSFILILLIVNFIYLFTP